MLLSAGTAPLYGFGFYREYGLGPEYLAVGHAYNSAPLEISQRDWTRIVTWAGEIPADRTRSPQGHRYARGMILDVFPMNVLAPIHLEQPVGGQPLHQWILQNTGAESLIKLAEHCFTWHVPADRIAAVAATIEESGLIMATAKAPH